MLHMSGTQLLTPTVQNLAVSLMHQEVGSAWSSKWDAGPDDPVHWLKAVVQKTLALGKWLEKAENGSLLNSELDLSDLFHPDTFLNALRQQTAR